MRSGSRIHVRGIHARMARLVVAGLALTFAGAALAADAKGKNVEPPRMTHPMQVVIVADSRAGCEPDCAEWISAEGEIGPGTPALFRRVFKALGPKRLRRKGFDREPGCQSKERSG